jgi:hypothetical protein
MRDASEPAYAPDAPLELPALRVLPAADPMESLREELIRRLAADRLRDLRDDGVTRGYVARMYGVEPELMESVASELLPSP